MSRAAPNLRSAPTVARLGGLLKTPEGGGLAELEPALADFGADLPSSLRWNCGIRLPDDEVPVAADEMGITVADAGFEISLVPGESPEALLEAVTGLSDTLGGVVDSARCAIVAGTAYLTLTNDGGRFILFFGGHLIEGMSLESFDKWWFEEHGPIAYDVWQPLGISYEQLHADPGLTKEANARAGFGDDGCLFFESITADSADHFFTGMTEEAGARFEEHEQGVVARELCIGLFARPVS